MFIEIFAYHTQDLVMLYDALVRHVVIKEFSGYMTSDMPTTDQTEADMNHITTSCTGQTLAWHMHLSCGYSGFNVACLVTKATPSLLYCAVRLGMQQFEICCEDSSKHMAQTI